MGKSRGTTWQLRRRIVSQLCPSNPEGISSVAGIRLLIIDDDADQRELIRETLEDRFGRGTTVGVGDGVAALAQPLAQFDMILVDYNLPDMSGIQLLEEIRRHCHTPLIMVTGENVGRTPPKPSAKAHTDYIVKVGDYLFTIPLVIEKNLTVAKIKRENESLHVELEQALAEVRDKNAQLEKSLRKVEELAATEPLTGLYNRRHFARCSSSCLPKPNATTAIWPPS